MTIGSDGTGGTTPTPGSNADLKLPTWLTQPAFLVGAILALVAAFYAPDMLSWFAADDMLILRGAEQLTFWTYVREAFDFRDFVPLGFFAYRPLYFITTACMYYAFGFNPLPWHVTALAVHLSNVWLVWWIARRMSASNVIGYVSAAIFGVHPVYSITVVWISGTNSLVAMTGQLICFVAFLKYMDRRGYGWYTLSLVAYAAGLFYHQEIFLLPVALVLWFVLTRCHSIKDVVRPRTWLQFLPIAAITLVFLFVQGYNTTESGFDQFIRPTTRAVELFLGSLAISVYPRNFADIGWSHLSIDAVIVLVLGLVAWKRPQYRAILTVMAVWYAASLALSVVFFGGAAGMAPLAVITRKIYSAGPALAIAAAVCLDSLWSLIRPRIPQSLILAPPVVLSIAALAFAFETKQDLTHQLVADGQTTKAFYQALNRQYPNLPERSVLYIAGTPEILFFPSCPVDRVVQAEAPTLVNSFCYLDNLIAAMYGVSIQAIPIARAEARDPAFVAGLGDADVVFCYRCDDP